jgi:hypothetical protein
MQFGSRLVTTAVLAAVLAWASNAQAQNKCSSGEMKAIGKRSAALLSCYAKASAKAVPVDLLCVGKATSKFQAVIQKLMANQDAMKPETLCNGFVDDHDITAHIDDVATDLDPLLPASTTAASTCTAKKLKCSGKKFAAVAKCYANALAAGAGVDPACLTSADAKLVGGGVGCFDKLEAKENPPKNPPTNVCVEPAGDGPTVGAKIDRWTFFARINASGSGAPTCPTLVTFTPTSTGGILDVGWTGNSHDDTVVSDATVTFAVSGCTGDGAAPACGTCTFSGPTENENDNAGQLHVQRCLQDTAIQCLIDTDCGTEGPCVAHYGTYLPFGGGGVSTCLENTFDGKVTGTVDVGTGAWAEDAKVTSRVFNGTSTSHPCPQCLGDTLANDGVQGGTCSSGLHSGAPCDASGASPNPSYATTSLDCPPLAGALIAQFAVNLSSTTGVVTRTLSAANPNCNSPGWGATACSGGQCKCQCDTCGSAAAEPCSSDADCTGGAICGGKRCLTGSNNGAPCAANSECPGGVCTKPGQPTAANQCDGGSGDCVPGDNSPGTSANDHICSSGPFEQFCGPVETFRGCFTDADCNGECGSGGACSDTCSGGRFRECFDNGVIGDQVKASGVADPFVGGVASPTLATLFCIPPSFAGSVNAANGFPGLGRLELGGHATHNGTPPPGPSSQVIFVSSAAYTGDLKALSGADIKCQSLASAAGLPGNFKAWLSDGTASAASRLVHSALPYKLVDGTLVANNWTQLTSGTLAHGISETETGTVLPGGFGVWTDTEANGSASAFGNACSNWTDGTSGSTAVFGIEGQSTSGWTANATISCDNVFFLYCIQQP